MIRFSPFLAYLVKDLYLVSPAQVFLEFGDLRFPNTVLFAGPPDRRASTRASKIIQQDE
jgi:hypothetical protein